MITCTGNNHCTAAVEEGLVINLHFTDYCNYHCRFCHSHYGLTPLSLRDWQHIIDNIVSGVKVKRFNLAGGEPLAAPYVQGLIDYIRAFSIDCSIITNGSLLTADFVRRNQGKLSMVGISIDGISREDNLRIGRATLSGATLDADRLCESAAAVRDTGMKLKINTVVNALNRDLDFHRLISRLQPDRWKILRMILINGMNDVNRDLLVTDREYEQFVSRHRDLSPVVENTGDIVNAYIVVNPHGRLIDNSDEHYTAGNPLLTHSFAGEFAKIRFNREAYLKRYSTVA